MLKILLTLNSEAIWAQESDDWGAAREITDGADAKSNPAGGYPCLLEVSGIRLRGAGGGGGVRSNGEEDLFEESSNLPGGGREEEEGYGRAELE